MAEPLLSPTQDARSDTWTHREIRQQPDTLRATQALLMEQRGAIAAFLEPLLARRDLRIIMTGAGTSAFIGDCLAPSLSQALGRPVEAIATTDIVSSPHLYVRRDVPTLLVSFGRSGNSPESLAAIDLADSLVEDMFHLILTCNGDGRLASRATPRALVLTLPEATHDRAFAMTSSFSAMLLAALAIFGGITAMDRRIAAITAAVADQLDRAPPVMAQLAQSRFERVVYLGSGAFKGLAREAALKLMELSDGAVVTAYDTALGFRHGPKTIINARTLVVMFMSNDQLTGQYDRDMLAELHRDGRCGKIIAIAAQPVAGDALPVAGMADAQDCDLLFAYVVPAQLLGLAIAQALQLNPDQPNRNGTVNRVVQGVQIHAMP